MTRWLATLLVFGAASALAAADFAYVSKAETSTAVVIDSRPRTECKAATLPGARCLPAEDFLGPHRRLASERDILWMLGTAGLSGSEEALVVGQDATARDFVAGVLYLAGQKSVRILTEPLPRLGGATAPGQERGILRTAVYTAPMRDRLWVLKHEVLAGEPLLLDGRSEAEYWGETVRGARGGHLPGALRLPVVNAAGTLQHAGDAVAYAHDAWEGIVYFTRLVAGQGLAVRVYPGGWAEWAADGSLPADAVSYPERQVTSNNAVPPAPTFNMTLALALLAATGVAFAAGWALARGRRT